MSTLVNFTFLQRLQALTLAVLLAALLGLSGCKKTDNPTPSPAGPAVKLTTTAALGSFLTDGQGNTLYYYGRDVNGTNACSGSCALAWPLFYAAEVSVGPGLNAADFTTGQTAGGEKQTFYKGWPLYYFSPAVNGKYEREKPGETLGEGLGKNWYVARPDYSVMVAMNSVVNKRTSQTSTKLYLTDPQGRTLYTFEKDAQAPASQPSNCTGSCITAWPVFYQEKIVAPSGLKATDFGTITRADGPNGAARPQSTYKGLPLYYYSPDGAVRGKVEGDGVGGTGNGWFVAVP